MQRTSAYSANITWAAAGEVGVGGVIKAEASKCRSGRTGLLRDPNNHLCEDTGDIANDEVLLLCVHCGWDALKQSAVSRQRRLRRNDGVKCSWWSYV